MTALIDWKKYWLLRWNTSCTGRGPKMGSILKNVQIWINLDDLGWFGVSLIEETSKCVEKLNWLWTSDNDLLSSPRFQSFPTAACQRLGPEAQAIGMAISPPRSRRILKKTELERPNGKNPKSLLSLWHYGTIHFPFNPSMVGSPGLCLDLGSTTSSPGNRGKLEPAGDKSCLSIPRISQSWCVFGLIFVFFYF